MARWCVLKFNCMLCAAMLWSTVLPHTMRCGVCVRVRVKVVFFWACGADLTRARISTGRLVGYAHLEQDYDVAYPGGCKPCSGIIQVADHMTHTCTMPQHASALRLPQTHC